MSWLLTKEERAVASRCAKILAERFPPFPKKEKRKKKRNVKK